MKTVHVSSFPHFFSPALIRRHVSAEIKIAAYSENCRRIDRWRSLYILSASERHLLRTRIHSRIVQSCENLRDRRLEHRWSISIENAHKVRSQYQRLKREDESATRQAIPSKNEKFIRSIASSINYSNVSIARQKQVQKLTPRRAASRQSTVSAYPLAAPRTFRSPDT